MQVFDFIQMFTEHQQPVALLCLKDLVQIFVKVLASTGQFDTFENWQGSDFGQNIKPKITCSTFAVFSQMYRRIWCYWTRLRTWNTRHVLLWARTHHNPYFLCAVAFEICLQWQLDVSLRSSPIFCVYTQQLPGECKHWQLCRFKMKDTPVSEASLDILAKNMAVTPSPHILGWHQDTTWAVWRLYVLFCLFI